MPDQAAAHVDDPAAGMTVVVRYFAGAAAAAGLTEEKVPLPAGATLAVLVEDLVARHGTRLARVLAAASFLLDEVGGDAQRPLHDGACVDVLPPFAGG
nr:MoaD/ThiS family protein [Kineosporia sp. A_224]